MEAADWHGGSAVKEQSRMAAAQSELRSKAMLIINADDFGRSPSETNAALECHRRRRITSASAMVFMSDSTRAAELAKEYEVDVGLHLNFDEKFTGNHCSDTLMRQHNKVATFLRRTKWSQIVYNPFLRHDFAYSCEAQVEEFERLFGKPPSHIDGHHHMQLCANLLFSRPFPPGTKMRRNFSFSPGEKGIVNRTYRAAVDAWVTSNYVVTDYFFDLSQSLNGNKIQSVIALAGVSNVELMTHPVIEREAEYLRSDEFADLLHGLTLGSYVDLNPNEGCRAKKTAGSVSGNS